MINPEDEYFDSSDEEEVKNVLMRRKKREKEKRRENQKKMLESERKKKINEETKIRKEREIKRKKLAEKQKKLSMTTKEMLKENKDKANMFYSYFSDLEGDKDPNKNKATSSKNNKVYNIPYKKEKKEESYDIENEKNKDKIITALLLDKNLMKDNESMNRLLANENGVKKDIRYKLLQLENPLYNKNIKRTSSGNNNKIISNSNKSSKSNFSINNNLDQNKKIRRIEDKLLDYGKALKQKKSTGKS